MLNCLSLLILSLLLSLAEAGKCFPDAGSDFLQGAKGETINLGHSNWLASRLNVEVLKIILEERLGCEVGLVDVLTNEELNDLKEKKIHAYPERWDPIPSDVDASPSSNIALVFPLGIFGKVGIYLPEYVVEANHDLENWRALRIPENTKIFAKNYSGPINGTSTAKTREQIERLFTSSSCPVPSSPASSNCSLPSSSSEVLDLFSLLSNLQPVANYTSGDPSTRGQVYSPAVSTGWESREVKFVEQLNLNLDVIELLGDDMEGLLIELIQSNYTAQVPFLTYFWTPHQIHDPRSGIKLSRIQMVDRDDRCVIDPMRPACYYLDSTLQSILSQDLKDHHPLVFQFMKSFKYRSNDDQNSMLADVFYDGLNETEAACKWILSNLDYVESLLPTTGIVWSQPYSSSTSIIAVVFASLFILLTLIIMGFINYFRDHVVIKAASLSFCNVILIGSLAAYSSIFMFIDRPSPAKCILQPFLLCSGYVLMYCSLVLKNFRIWRIFSNPFEVSSSNFSNLRLAMIEGIVVLIELVFLVAWFLMDPPMPVTEIATDGVMLRLYCGSSDKRISTSFAWLLFSLNAGLVALGVVLGFLTRKVYSEFNESRYIGFAIYNVTILGLIVLPLISIPDVATEEARFAILTLGIAFSTAFTVFTLFVPKIIFIFFPHLAPHKNSVDQARRSGSAAVGVGELTNHSASTKAHEVEIAMKSVGSP